MSELPPRGYDPHSVSDLLRALHRQAENYAPDYGDPLLARLLGDVLRAMKHMQADRLELDRAATRFMRERDEARRAFCVMHPTVACGDQTPQQAAASFGWLSCFDVLDTRGLDGDPKEPPACAQVLVQGSLVDEGSHA